jgi:hypothetical protein
MTLVGNNPVEGPDEEDRWDIIKEIYQLRGFRGEFVKRMSVDGLGDPDQQGRLPEDSQAYRVRVWRDYETIVEQKNKGDEIYYGYDQLYFNIKRYDGKVVKHDISRQFWSWIKDGPKGEITRPMTVPPALKPPNAHDLRFEWEE